MRRAWRGATGGVIAAAILIATLTGAFFWSGLGTVLDALIGAVAGAIAVAVFGGATLGVVAMANRLPRYFLAGLGGAIGAIITAEAVDFGWPDTLFYPGLLVFVWTQAVLAGALWVIVTGGLKQAARRKQVVVLALLLGALGINATSIIWLADAGPPPEPVAAASATAPPVAPLESNPSEPGTYAVRTLFYGSGTDIQRPEYGADVDLRTASVDGSLILPEWKGFTADVRAWYWGFGIENLPINGRVWMPEGDGPFPLVLIAHGNHGMHEYSDPGYAYLGELLASRGFITVSVDENFINGSWSGDFGGDEIPARAWLLLKHLEQWRQWNATEGSPFYRRVDMERIALVGHSRGGEAVPLAARFNTLPAFPDNTDLTFDFGFQIRSLVALAPTDYRYERRIALQDINYLTLQGSYDSDERSFFGIRQYQRIAFSDGFDGFKAGLYIHRANHGQFNSIWGATDTGPPSSWLLNTEPLIDGSAQRQVAKLYIAAFVEATLRGRSEYVPLFRNHRTAGAWLPETVFVHRYSDPSYRPVATYEEDLDVTTASLQGSTIQTRHLTEWSEQDLPFRGERTQQTHAVLLGWGKASDPTDSTSSEQGATASSRAAYTIALPDTSSLIQQLDENAALVFSMARRLGDESDEDASSAPAGADSFDIQLELTDAAGATVTRALSQSAVIPPVLKTQFLKIGWLSRDRFGTPWEPVMQTYEVPLREFVEQNQGFDFSALRQIGFTFDRGQQGHLALDDIGFRRVE
jgi:dienelactone hydrolase